VPLPGRGQAAGAICLEDVEMLEGTRDFIRTVANMLALHIAADGGRDTPMEVQPRKVASTAPGTTITIERSHSASLAARSLDPSQLAADVYTDVAVLVLRLPDPTVLASRSAEDAPTLADAIACVLQQLAEQNGVPYLKFLSQEAVAATGFDVKDEEATARIAALAVELRDRLTALFESAGSHPDFRIGIDCGIAMGCAVGQEPRMFNLWGEAVQTAGAMAASASPGAIQATEAAYVYLRQHFLFRPRGSFYLPNIGEARTFVLAGQL
jgi:adenylate cyclase